MQKHTSHGHHQVQTSFDENIEAVNVWSLDKEYNYTFFNNAHKTAMKKVWNADISIGSNIISYINDPDYIGIVKENYRILLQGGSHRSTDHFTLETGEEFYYENFGNPIYSRDGVISGIMFYTVNITEKIKLQNRLEFSLSLLQSIMNSPDNIHILSIDKEYRYLFFNNAHSDSMIDTWGTKAELGKNILEMLPDPAYRKRVKDFYDKALRGEQAKDSSEITDISGKKNFYENIAAPIYTADGDIQGITVFIFNITERENAIKETRKSLSEKEILLKEIHHRVKNNLQLVSSMISLQLDTVDESSVQGILEDCLNRINTMSGIHQTLYRNDNLARIDIKDHFQRLVESIVELFGKPASEILFEIKTGNIELELDQAIPLSLIVNELITNCLKYAFDEQGTENKRISIILNLVTDGYHLQVVDNGKGLPDDNLFANTTSLGMNLVSIFTEQLGGRVEYSSEKGLKVDIYF